MVLDQTFSFDLSPGEYKRVRKLVYPALTMPRWYWPVIFIVNVELLTSAVLRHRDLLWTIAEALTLCANAVMAAVSFAWPRKPRLAVAGSLRFTDAGLVGTLDATPVTIGWTEIASVRDLDDSIVLMRRRGAGAIAIPKANIDGVNAFWAYLEDRFVAKRGLVRPSAPRKYITNNAY